MPVYNSDNYIVIINLEASSLWQYYRVEQALNFVGDVIDFPDNNNSASFKLKQKIIGQSGNDGIKDVKNIVPLKLYKL